MIGTEFDAALAAWNDLDSRFPNALEVSTDVSQCGDEPTPGMVLRRDAVCELGGLDTGHMALLLRQAPSVPVRDTVRAIGTPLRRLRRAWNVPLTLGVRVTASECSAKDYETLIDVLRAPAVWPGCLVQGSADSLRVRVGKSAVRNGCTLEGLAAGFAAVVRRAMPASTGIDVILAVGDESAVNAVAHVGSLAAAGGRELRRQLYAERGVDFTCGNTIAHCGSCKDRDTCTTVRQMMAMRAAKLADAPTDEERLHA